ncbi:MAG TPA: IS66 family insertion sequence element accessory protein TnpB [Verrucomicrobiae bacterium]
MTTLTSENGAILKVDAKGRVQTPPERREQLLDEFEKSGLSGAKFAALSGIKYQTFAAWATRRRQQRGLPLPTPSKKTDPVCWLEAVVSEAATTPANALGPVKVGLGTGAWVEFSQLSQVNLVAALIRALQKSSTSC